MVDLMVNEQQSGTAEKGVPAGFKLTEVGVIPDDWDVKTIGQLNPFITSGSRGWADFYVDYGDLFVRITNMNRRSIYLDTTISNNKFVSLPATSTEGKRTHLNNGDILISITADIGIIGYVDESIAKPAYINQHISLVRFDDEAIDNKFIAYFLASENVQKKFLANSDLGAKAGMNLNGVRSISFAFPTKKEQSAIANALTDIDALIVELKKILTKTQAIKTATMQQLLTGKTRLPQFALREDGMVKGYKKSELGEIPEDWTVVEMSKVGIFGRGRVISHNEINRAYSQSHPVYSSQTTNYGVMGYLDTFDFEGEFVTWTTDGVNAGKVFYRNGKFNCTNVCGVIKVKDANAQYIAIAMDQEARKFVSTNLANPKLMNGVAKQVLIRMPNTMEEQAAIAAILSDMDKEIQTLQQRLDKTRQIKQGMMQELLTGKTRLI